MGLGLYGKEMHDYIITEIELGERAANALDDEWLGFGPLLDLQYELYLARNEPEAPPGPHRRLVEMIMRQETG